MNKSKIFDSSKRLKILKIVALSFAGLLLLWFTFDITGLQFGRKKIFRKRNLHKNFMLQDRLFRAGKTIRHNLRWKCCRLFVSNLKKRQMILLIHRKKILLVFTNRSRSEKNGVLLWSGTEKIN